MYICDIYILYIILLIIHGSYISILHVRILWYSQIVVYDVYLTCNCNDCYCMIWCIYQNIRGRNFGKREREGQILPQYIFIKLTFKGFSALYVSRPRNVPINASNNILVTKQCRIRIKDPLKCYKKPKRTNENPYNIMQR